MPIVKGYPFCAARMASDTDVLRNVLVPEIMWSATNKPMSCNDRPDRGDY